MILEGQKSLTNNLNFRWGGVADFEREATFNSDIVIIIIIF